MSIDCPQCASRDQVQTVRSVYEAQSGTYAGVTTGATVGVGSGGATIVGRTTFHTSGTQSTRLADHLAPPPAPSITKPRGGCLLAAMCAAPVLAAVLTVPLLLSGSPKALFNALVFWCAISMPFVVVAAVLIGRRVGDHGRARAAFAAQTAAHPGLMAVWSAAYVCVRCHLAYVPADAIAAAGPRIAPVPQFQHMVVALANGLRRP